MSELLTARLRTGADARLARGVVAGLAAGLLFLFGQHVVRRQSGHAGRGAAV
jgi:hypothetical protein